MLVALRIRDLALIDEMEIHFDEGFTVLSGETGAGKSLIVGALGLVQGRRARPEEVRSGASSAEVEALFDISGCAPANALLASWELGSENELVLRRVLSAEGRSKAYLNGRLVTLSQIEELAGLLLTISSQREHQRLLEPRFQLDVLDQAAGLQDALAEMGERHDALVKAESSLQELLGRAREDAARLDFLSYQLKEIEGLKPGPDELAELEADLNVLRHVGRIEEISRSSEDLIYSGDRSASGLLGSAAKSLLEAARLDPRIEGISTQVREAEILVSDAAHALQKYLSALDADPDRLSALEERHEDLKQLLRKHRVSTLGEVLALAEKLRSEVDLIRNYDERLDALKSGLDESRRRAVEQARVLSEARKGHSRKLGRAVEQELKDLGLAKAKLKIRVEPEPAVEGQPRDGEVRITRRGRDRVEFILAPNPGEPELPLRSIASGGELSRVMLALHCALSGRAAAPSSIYDEVDAGVGGAVAHAVGMKLKSLASDRQVICITHLAQVAALADHHFAVRKEARAGRTVTFVEGLTGKERVDEVARMIGGPEITPRARAAARELMSLGGDTP